VDSKTIRILIGGNWWNNGKILIKLGGGEN
jgi:hypothetical protein